MSQSLLGAMFLAPSNMLMYLGICDCRPIVNVPSPRCKADLVSQDKFHFQNNGLLSLACVSGKSSGGINCLVPLILFFYIR